MHILHVVGARPNFMKAAPLLTALRQRGCRQTLVHTGQHYDPAMSDVFFEQLELPAPDVNLDVRSGSHAQQTAEIMARFEPVVLAHRPDVVLVYGDVNSTMAAALVCAKLQIALGHVEAGLRSFDRTMPEEVNRVVTDQLADFLFTPSPDADANLQREGMDGDKIFLVGNVMIDSLVRLLPLAQRSLPPGLPPRYALVTLHRPGNVDEEESLREIADTLLTIHQDLPVVFPAHPRTQERLARFGVDLGQLYFMDPLPYLQFLALQARATVVITDSGGMQEETTYLGVPCLTLREHTERPITVTEGTNILVGHDFAKLRREVWKITAGLGKQGSAPALWDGAAAQRIADVLLQSAAQISPLYAKTVAV